MMIEFYEDTKKEADSVCRINWPHVPRIGERVNFVDYKPKKTFRVVDVGWGDTVTQARAADGSQSGLWISTGQCVSVEIKEDK